MEKDINKIIRETKDNSKYSEEYKKRKIKFYQGCQMLDKLNKEFKEFLDKEYGK